MLNKRGISMNEKDKELMELCIEAAKQGLDIEEILKSIQNDEICNFPIQIIFIELSLFVISIFISFKLFKIFLF